jgi:hypothetical protein
METTRAKTRQVEIRRRGRVGLPLSARAEEALQLLVEHGCDEARLRSILDGAREVPSRVLLADVRRLRAAAEHVDGLLSRFLLDTSEGWAELMTRASREATICTGKLVRYAKYLEASLEALKKQWPRDDATKALLIGYVETCTRKSHDAQVATVLAAVLQSPRNCTRDGIKMFRKRHSDMIDWAREWAKGRRHEPHGAGPT